MGPLGTRHFRHFFMLSFGRINSQWKLNLHMQIANPHFGKWSKELLSMYLSLHVFCISLTCPYKQERHSSGTNPRLNPDFTNRNCCIFAHRRSDDGQIFVGISKLLIVFLCFCKPYLSVSISIFLLIVTVAASRTADLTANSQIFAGISKLPGSGRVRTDLRPK